MLKIGTSKMGSVIECPRCRKSIVVPPQSIPQAEQLYQMLENKRSVEKAPLPPPVHMVHEPTVPESAWDDLGGNVDDADLNRMIDELWTTSPPNPQDSFATLYPAPLSMPNPVTDDEVALRALQKRYKYTLTLLYVSTAVAFCVGIIVGIILHAVSFQPAHSSLSHMSGETALNEISGTIYFRNENGDRWHDVDAVIICLPMDRPMAQLLSPQGLRPEDVVNNDTAQLIQEMGGMYAKADVNGSFTLYHREGVRYFVILISANQKRSGEMKPSTLLELRRFFRDPDQFGENCLLTDEYEWSGGMHAFRHTFEMGD